jgi:hypothetical protein
MGVPDEDDDNSGKYQVSELNLGQGSYAFVTFPNISEAHKVARRYRSQSTFLFRWWQRRLTVEFCPSNDDIDWGSLDMSISDIVANWNPWFRWIGWILFFNASNLAWFLNRLLFLVICVVWSTPMIGISFLAHPELVSEHI